MNDILMSIKLAIVGQIAAAIINVDKVTDPEIVAKKTVAISEEIIKNLSANETI